MKVKRINYAFFEWGRTWSLKERSVIVEQQVVAGIVFDRKKMLDFYEMKMLITELLAAIGLTVVWEKSGALLLPWYSEHQTAYLMHDGHKIGIAGIVNAAWFNHLVEGSAFVFELDGDFLLTYKQPPITFRPLAKYPTVWLDVSALVPLTVTADRVAKQIQSADNRIMRVELVDFFERPEWSDKRSLTFRYYVQDSHKTLEKDEIEKVIYAVAKVLTNLGATIR